MDDWPLLRQRTEQQAAARGGARLLSMLTRDAAERYLALQIDFPDTWQLLPQHFLASYLGVTPQYLCDLKKHC